MVYIADPRKRAVGLAVALLLVASAILAIERPWQDRGCRDNEYGTPNFCDVSAGAWINSEPLLLEDLEGKVVLVDFWTYSCINCIRTLPHLTALYDTYAPYGFVLVGVHSPEFRFEHERSNVEAAIEKHGIHYPVVQDNDFRIWDNYHNRFWPTHYLIDASGDVVDTHIGEGGYQETETRVRELLLAAGATDLPPPVEDGVDVGVRGSDITPELYAGYGRQPEALGNPEGYHPDEVVDYSADDAPERDRIYLDGAWHNGREAMTSQDAGSVYLRFQAGAANVVVVPEGDAVGACAPVYLDGAPITRDDAGPSVRFDRGAPCILLAGSDSYDLYAGPVEEHVLRIDVPAGFGLYTFAFSSYGT